MRLSDLHQPLYEGLDRKAKSTVMLWESAGRKIMEAELTADQINQLFTAVEKGASDAGGNRTMLGKGKDAAEAVNKAWEDLKSKIQDSGPIKDVDNAYDSAIAKIESGLGGPDNAVNKVIQKYRKFAKEHPIAQGFIYSALIAAAGISGAGLGGAAVLGLLKMTDKLLQGDKFSSAVYKGAKTGAMAYGASKIGDMIKGDKGAPPASTPGTPTPPANADTLADIAKDPNLNPIQQKFAADLAAGKNIQGADEYLQKAIQSAAKKAQMMGDMPDGSANEGMRQFMSLQKLQNAILDPSAGSGATDVASTAQQIASGTVSNAMDKTQQAADAAANTDVGSVADAASNVDTSTATDAATTAATPDATQADTSTATDAAANASGGGIKAAFTDGNNGTLTDVDGDTVPMTAYPPGQMQPRMPYGAEKVDFDWNGKKVTAWVYGRKAYVPDFDATATESYVYAGTALSESQINKLIFIASRLQLNEGPWDSVKQAAGSAVDWAKTKGHNLTTKITADKLKSAWKDAGSPTDSAAVTQALVGAGADEGVITQALQTMGVDTTATPATDATDAGDGRVEPTMDAPASAPSAQAQDDKQEPTMADPTQDAQQGAEQPADQAGADQAQQQGNVDVAGLSKLLASVGKNPTPFKAAVAAIKANKPLTPVMKAALGNAFIDMVYLDPGTTGQVSSILKKVSSK